MVPPEVAVDIKAKFPNVKMMVHKSMLTSGFAVEIEVDGKLQRNGWQITKDTDWQDVKQKAMTWLTSRYQS